VLLAAAIVSGCQREQRDEVAAPDDGAARVVAVARFEIAPTIVVPEWDPLETTLLHDETIQALVKANVMDVVERTRLERVLEEQQLTKNEITDPARAAALGKVLGADYFVLGTLRRLSLDHQATRLPYTDRTERRLAGRARVDLRVVEVETSRIAFSDSADVALTRSGDAAGAGAASLRAMLEELQREAGHEVALLVVDALAPIRVAGVRTKEIDLDRGGATAPIGATFDVVDDDGRRVARVEVTESLEGSSVAAVVDQNALIEVSMRCRRAATPPPTVEARHDPLEDRW